MIECLTCGRPVDQIPCADCAAADEHAARRDQERHKAIHGVKVDGAALKTFGRGRRTS